jgi:hypothetical protein
MGRQGMTFSRQWEHRFWLMRTAAEDIVWCDDQNRPWTPTDLCRLLLTELLFEDQRYFLD